MDINDCCGEIIGGDTTKLTIRQKSNGGIEVGDLLIEEKQEGKFLLQVFELRYGSQISDSALESISGMRLEGIGGSLDFIDPHLRNYVIASAKVALDLTTEKPRNPKILPDFMGSVRHIKNEDLNFLTKPDYPLYLGKIRSGSKVIDTDIFLNGNDVIPHHILIPATTGRGKSNLIKVMLWNVLDKDFCGILVLDPHDEYYGKTNVKGLRDHPKAREFIRYYSPSYEQGAYTLVVNLRSIHPHHFRGISNFSEAQEEAMAIAYHQYRDDWIESILNGTEIENVNSTTIHVLRRKLDKILGVYYDSTDNQIKCRNRTFSNSDGEATMKDITTSLEQCKKVIIDTSRLEDEAELLIGSIIAQQILHLHKSSKEKNELQNKPVISIVIEEAPRVLGDQVLRTSGSNVYSDIAKEGRKFKIGLIAITQLTSVIPKTILANMNTKIILGNELNTERNAIIQSASQDLSNDDRNIASLDKGEAIISSNFARFAVPVKIPLFEDEVRKHLQMVTKKHRIGVIS